MVILLFSHILFILCSVDNYAFTYSVFTDNERDTFTVNAVPMNAITRARVYLRYRTPGDSFSERRLSLGKGAERCLESEKYSSRHLDSGRGKNTGNC